MLRFRAHVGERRCADEQRRVDREDFVTPGRGEALTWRELHRNFDAGAASQGARPGAGGDDDARRVDVPARVPHAAHAAAFRFNLRVMAVEYDLEICRAAREGLNHRVRIQPAGARVELGGAHLRPHPWEAPLYVVRVQPFDVRQAEAVQMSDVRAQGLGVALRKAHIEVARLAHAERIARARRDQVVGVLEDFQAAGHQSHETGRWPGSSIVFERGVAGAGAQLAGALQQNDAQARLAAAQGPGRRRARRPAANDDDIRCARGLAPAGKGRHGAHCRQQGATRKDGRCMIDHSAGFRYTSGG